MTPLLMQSIRLLQLTHVELEQFIEQEIEKNPLLERAETNDEHFSLSEQGFGADRNSSDDGEFGRSTMSGDLDAEGNRSSEPGDHWLESGEITSSGSMSDTFDSSLENIFPDDPGTHDFIAGDLASQWKSSSGDGYVSSGGEGFNLEQVTASPVTIRDHVGEQILFAFEKATDRLIAAELADHLDEMGYLRADVAEIAERLGVEAAHIEKLITVMQGFEPAGLFARDLAECLAIQLCAKNRLDPPMKILLQHLELLAKRDFHSLKKLCGATDADILDMLQEIQLLDPKPGTAFSSGVADSIIPDVQVDLGSDGTWRIELNPSALPRVLVNNHYFATVSKAKASAADKIFLNDCLQNANWLTRSLDQRAQTILKVASEIVRGSPMAMSPPVGTVAPRAGDPGADPAGRAGVDAAARAPPAASEPVPAWSIPSCDPSGEPAPPPSTARGAPAGPAVPASGTVEPQAVATATPSASPTTRPAGRRRRSIPLPGPRLA